MANNSKEPKEFDAVLGRRVPPPVTGAVLGGIEGLHQRFASLNEQVRLDAVANASEYGDEGTDILIEALKDTSLQVRVSAYQILKHSNKALEEISKGIRLNIGDKIYCVYCSSLYYGDDWYYLKDSIDQNDAAYKDEEQLFYQSQSEDEDGYTHYVTALRGTKKVLWYYPVLKSLHISIDKAEKIADSLHIKMLLELGQEYGMIYQQSFYDKEQLSQWCKDNGLSITNNYYKDEDEDEDEYEYDLQIKIFKFLQQSIDIDLIKKFWEFTAYGHLAFVYEKTIDRKCYLKTTDNI